MTTESQVHVLNEGESVVLECNFHADNYNLFDFPVLWRKFQRGEETQMNIMGNMNEPFAASNRFEAAFTSLAPRYKFELSVLGEKYSICWKTRGWGVSYVFSTYFDYLFFRGQQKLGELRGTRGGGGGGVKPPTPDKSSTVGELNLLNSPNQNTLA